jgi:hypothetical protein
MKQPKKDTSHMLKPSRGFTVNEWLETLIRVRDDEPVRYAREVSPGLQVTVKRYAELKAEAMLKKAA